jgi:hypothetical protein
MYRYRKYSKTQITNISNILLATKASFVLLAGTPPRPQVLLKLYMYRKVQISETSNISSATSKSAIQAVLYRYAVRYSNAKLQTL